ncbi:hypothetical protein B0T17DRAFT_504079 [Bombardia bombarda]|uniref:Uncharacterized protein n=1 Tax=Bombardia bombarda TaxID=252184 RepID=A0AA40CGG6_9PEZI|nr:hypothetical protein B0T17DRAFT_504079 [Bombardia bombarda]
MAPWPFRRKSRRKRPSTLPAVKPGETSSRGRAADTHLSLPPNPTRPAVPISAPSPETQQVKKQRSEPNKLQRRPRTYSFSPDRNDAIKVVRQTGAGAKRTRDDDGDNLGSGVGATNIDDDAFRRAPTLHNKRDGDHLPRKKSSKKRRRDDQQREAEIKAMSNFMPLRPATEDWTAGRPMKKDSKRVRNGIGFGFRGSSRNEWDNDNRSSDISLPLAESIHSSMSSDSEHISFKVSVFEALAPRPTLQYTVHARSGPGSHEAGDMPFRRSSQRQQRKLSMPIPEATLRAHKRIDNLADDLNASDLRELMERDNRRRERKQQRIQEKLQRDLARQAEKHIAADREARRQGRESPPNLERGVLGRESFGLGVDPASAVITSSRRRQPSDSPRAMSKRPVENEDITMEDDSQPNPLTAFHRTDSIPLGAQPIREPEEHLPPLTSPKSRSSFLRSKISRSKSPQESHSESLQKGSETSSSRGPLSWTSFFKWGNKNRHSSGGPSSFSNTSRDSMQTTTQLPTPPVNFAPRRSRVQSPEADVIPPTPLIPAASVNNNSNHGLGGTMTFVSAQVSTSDTPTSERRSIEAMRQTPSTFGHPDEPPLATPEPQTISLASIDSEASWLSGRISKKRKSSGILQPAPYSQMLQRTSESETEQTGENDTLNLFANEGSSIITDDDYLSRFARSKTNPPGLNRMSTGEEARPSSDEEEEAHWGSVKGQQPKVIHVAPSVERMKSREGLLKSFGDEGEANNDGAGDSPVSGAGDDGVQRATSINLGQGHARRISAGSARLLSITPRLSADGARRSMSPQL